MKVSFLNAGTSENPPTHLILQQLLMSPFEDGCVVLLSGFYYLGFGEVGVD